MTHNRSFRALAAIISVWLSVCLAEPMQLHLCVMHGGLAVQSIGHAGSHSSHGAAAQDAHHPAKSHEDSPQCSCLGDCTAGSGAAVLAIPHLRVALPAVSRVGARATALFRPVAAGDLLLPFSNGPPTASSLA